MKKVFVSMLSLAFVLPLIAIFCSTTQAQVYVGTYSRRGSEGVYRFQWDAQNGKLKKDSVIKNMKDPSFLTLDASGKNLYVVHEAEGGAVQSFKKNKSGSFVENGKPVSTIGAHPCYVSLSKNQRWVIAANYNGGSFSVHPVASNGSVLAATQFIQHYGSSINERRQKSPHVHSADFTPDGKYLLICDLGTDEVRVYPFLSTAKTHPVDTNQVHITKITPGGGPRHLTIHPNGKFVFVIEELTAQLAVFSLQQGKLVPLQRTPLLPSDYQGGISGAEVKLHPSLPMLYLSLRAINEIVYGSIDTATGQFTLLGRITSGGKTPRHFEIDPTGKFMIVANQDSDNLVVYPLHPTTGLPLPAVQDIAVPAPVCVVFDAPKR